MYEIRYTPWQLTSLEDDASYCCFAAAFIWGEEVPYTRTPCAMSQSDWNSPNRGAIIRTLQQNVSNLIADRLDGTLTVEADL